MVKNNKILGIVPARGGSKGVPGKNIIDVCGRPLISYSIETGNALVQSGALARCIVSTDSVEIANMAKQWQADIPFMRPDEHATDTAKAISYVVHALDTLEAQGETYTHVMLLQPTSPIRNNAAIHEAVNRYLQGNTDSLISAYPEDYINELVMYLADSDGYLRPKSPIHNKGVRRQEHGSTFVRNGALYITRVDYLRRTGQLVCDRPMLLEMRKVDSIDVDNFDDLELLRAVMCR